MTTMLSRGLSRDAVLVALYRIAEGSTLVMARVIEIAGAAEITIDETVPALDYLKDHGLVAYRAMGPMVALTPNGVDRSEELLFPKLDTDGLTLVLTVAERAEIETVVRQIRMAIENTPMLDLDIRATVEADVESLESQLHSPRPSRQVARSILRHILIMGENVFANVISAKLLGL